MRFYLLKCESCGAALASNVKQCPYCNWQSSHRALETDGNIQETSRGLEIKKGAHLQIGADPALHGVQRDCPFCGFSCRGSDSHCSHCKKRITIEAMHIRQSLKISGGSLTISGGGSLTIGGPSQVDERLLAAVKAGDLAKARQAVADGANVLYQFDAGSLAGLAEKSGHKDLKLYLLAMGAPDH